MRRALLSLAAVAVFPPGCSSVPTPTDAGSPPDGGCTAGLVACGSACCAPGGCNDATGTCQACTAEDDSSFCSRQGKTCGDFTGADNCGAQRSADCGSCAGNQTCDLATNTCACARACAGKSCGDDGCGGVCGTGTGPGGCLTGEVCTPAGSCIAGTGCAADADCAAVADKPRCEPALKVCVACRTSADCATSSGKICSGSFACVECVQGTDCSGVKRICDSVSSVCVECTKNADCTSGSCDTGSGTCQPALPGNDTCAGAAALALDAAATAGDTTLAKADYGDPGLSIACDTDLNRGGLAGADLVYSYTPTAAGDFVVTLTPTGWDAALWYTEGAASCGNAAACVHASDRSSNGPESLRITGVAGTTYYLVVDSYSTTEVGPFTIAVSTAPDLPKNDTCSGAITLTLAGTTPSATTTGDTTNASDDGSSIGCGGTGPDLVWAVTTTTAQMITATATPTGVGSTLRPVVYLRRTACGSTASGDQLACGQNLTAGQPATAVTGGVPPGTYWIWVDGYGGTSGAFTLTVTTDNPPPPPANDTCSGVEPLTLDAAVSGSTASAANDYGDGASMSAACDSSMFLQGLGLPGVDVVYSYTPGVSGDFIATVTPSGWDAALGTRRAPWQPAGAPPPASTGQTRAAPERPKRSRVSGVSGTTYYFVATLPPRRGRGRSPFSVGILRRPIRHLRRRASP